MGGKTRRSPTTRFDYGGMRVVDATESDDGLHDRNDVNAVVAGTPAADVQEALYRLAATRGLTGDSPDDEEYRRVIGSSETFTFVTYMLTVSLINLQWHARTWRTVASQGDIIRQLVELINGRTLYDGPSSDADETEVAYHGPTPRLRVIDVEQPADERTAPVSRRKKYDGWDSRNETAQERRADLPDRQERPHGGDQRYKDKRHWCRGKIGRRRHVGEVALDRPSHVPDDVPSCYHGRRLRWRTTGRVRDLGGYYHCSHKLVCSNPQCRKVLSWSLGVDCPDYGRWDWNPRTREMTPHENPEEQK